MAIERRKKPFQLSTGANLVVEEPKTGMSLRMGAIAQEARDLKAKSNGSGDPGFLYFYEMIYAPLAACSTGDVPTVEQAYQLPPEEWDRWHELARELDPETFGSVDAKPESVTFRDGSTITILPADRPSVLMKLHQLESDAEKQPQADNIQDEVVRVIYYPRLAACSVGDVPSVDEAVDWPTFELNTWYQAARRVNLRLFLPLEEIALQNQEAAEKAQKKRPRSRRKS